MYLKSSSGPINVLVLNEHPQVSLTNSAFCNGVSTITGLTSLSELRTVTSANVISHTNQPSTSSSSSSSSGSLTSTVGNNHLASTQNISLTIEDLIQSVVESSAAFNKSSMQNCTGTTASGSNGSLMTSDSGSKTYSTDDDVSCDLVDLSMLGAGVGGRGCIGESVMASLKSLVEVMERKGNEADLEWQHPVAPMDAQLEYGTGEQEVTFVQHTFLFLSEMR